MAITKAFALPLRTFESIKSELVLFANGAFAETTTQFCLQEKFRPQTQLHRYRDI